MAVDDDGDVRGQTSVKVLHVIPSVAPCRGGPSEAVLAMTRSLNRHGITADIVASTDNGPVVMEVPTGRFIDHEGARVCFLPRWSPKVGALREFQYAREFSPWLEQHLRDYDCLHVHAVFSFFSTRAMQMARRAGKPYLVRPLGQLDAWSLRQSALRKQLYLALIERTNLRGAAAVHVTSEGEAASVRALLPASRVEVIPHGVDARPVIEDARARLRGEFGIKAEGSVLLFLSRWHRKKNIDVLLDALALMKSEPWTLVLAGSTDDAELETQVRSQIAALGLSDRVICPGHVRGESKDVLLQGADMFVLPSSSENFGIAVAESLVSGTPVLVSPGVDLATVVRELNGGRVCQPKAETLAETLRAMLRDVAGFDARTRQRLRTAAEAKFSWAANAAALERLYTSVIHA